MCLHLVHESLLNLYTRVFVSWWCLYKMVERARFKIYAFPTGGIGVQMSKAQQEPFKQIEGSILYMVREFV